MTDFFNLDLPFEYHPLEVKLAQPDDFLKVRETLTRIGVASRRSNVLFQSCHILHKQGHYFIVHFKELFALDGKQADLSKNDLQRRNSIAKLLADWGLVVVIDPDKYTDQAPLSQIKILNYDEKNQWDLQAKYNIGKKRGYKEQQ
jgi:hypothetical protein